MRKAHAGIFAAVALGAALTLGACTSGGTQETSELEPASDITMESVEGTWNLVGAAGEEGVVEDLPEGTLTIEQDSFSFSAQCNQFSGSVAVEDGVLSTDQQIQTLMACDGPAGQVDDIAAAVLSDIQSSTLTAGDSDPQKLTLVGPGGASLDFELN